MTTTLSLATPEPSLEALEEALAPRVAGGAVFLPAPLDAPVGERVVVALTLASGEVALTFEGHVSWRHPPEAVPPGREAGVGVVVDEASDEARALLSRMGEQDGAGERAFVPGSRWLAGDGEPGWLRAPRARSDVEEERKGASFREGPFTRFIARTAAEVLEEHARRLEAARGEESPRPLPSPPPAAEPLPHPPLAGAFFVYADEGGRAGAVKHLERFSWPSVGTERPTGRDSRFGPPGDLDDDDTAPWDEITDGQRAAPWEVSDPGRRVTDVVGRALEEMADVDRALEDSSGAPTPPRGEAETSSNGGVGELSSGLRLRVDEGPTEPLFEAGAFVPAARTVTLRPTNGHPSVKVAVFEGDHEGEGRHLGTVRVQLPSGASTTSVRFELSADGFLEVSAMDDGSVAARWRTSSAPPVSYPRPAKRRGWRRWLPW